MGNTLIQESWDGYRWLVRRGLSHDAIPLSKGEYTILNTLKELSSKSKVFVDVGAHVGYYAVRMAKYYKEVLAFEPNPFSVEVLQANIEINNLTNVTVFPVALGDKTEQRVLYVRQAMTTLNPTPDATHKVPIKVDRLDNLIQKADVIKIDCEGWEERVILGANRIIEDNHPILVIEHHDHCYAECTGMRDRIKNYLYGKNYISIGFGDIEHWIYVPKNASLRPLIPLITKCWFDYTIRNVQNGKPWYYGLPYTWWWGLSHYDFITELPNHILEEEMWIRGVIA